MTERDQRNLRDVLLGRHDAGGNPVLRIAQLIMHAMAAGIAMLLFLNALMIGGVPAMFVGIIAGQAIEAWLLTLGVSELAATVVMWLTAVIVWAIPTIPGFYLLDPY